MKKLYWKAELDRLSPGLLMESEGAVLVQTAPLLALPPAVARRLVRRAIEMSKGDLRGIDFDHVEAILNLARRNLGQGRVQVPGLEVIRSFDWVRFAISSGDGVAITELAAPVPGKLQIPGTGIFISLELLEKPETSGSADYVYNSGMDGLDWARVSGSLAIRNWQPGTATNQQEAPAKKRSRLYSSRLVFPYGNAGSGRYWWRGSR